VQIFLFSQEKPKMLIDRNFKLPICSVLNRTQIPLFVTLIEFKRSVSVNTSFEEVFCKNLDSFSLLI
jgi:hypothetical protein